MISLVAAMTRKRVIGIDNGLPWRIPDEARHYKEIVSGKTVIMGGSTFREIGEGHLPGRHNIVVSRSIASINGADVCATIADALKKSKSYGDDVFIIGGQSIFEQSIGTADLLQISYIKKDYQGDKLFPEIDLNEWEVKSSKDFKDFEYVVYTRKARGRHRSPKLG